MISQYSIDKNRIYVTGQSMGGMISFYLNVKNPNFFAASLFVGSQWDVNVLEPLHKTKFFYIVSEGDPKVSKGMDALKNLFSEKQYPFSQARFSAQLSQAEQNAEIDKLIKQEKATNFVVF